MRFRPKLGRSRQSLFPSARSFLKPVKQAMELAGGARSRNQNSRFKGGGSRGSGARFRHGFSGQYQRRVIVKTRLIKSGSSGSPINAANALRAHLNYIERDSATRQNELSQHLDHDPNMELSQHNDQEHANLYGPDEQEIDRDAFIRNLANDRHHFRLIVSPEDGEKLSSLTDYTRDLMKGVEGDLGTKLDWVAVNHYNTAHPHTHIVVRGKDDRGKNLVIDREYISHGLRQRASNHLSLELGPRSNRDIAASLKRDVSQERYTRIDGYILAAAKENFVQVPKGRTAFDFFKAGLMQGRLKHLQHMGLATKAKAGKWTIATDLQTTLKKLGECGDIIRTMQREMGQNADHQIFENKLTQRAITGELISVGLSNELIDRKFIILKNQRGQNIYAEVGHQPTGTLPSRGAIVEISPNVSQRKASDSIIAEIADHHGGIYSIENHNRFNGPHRQNFLTSQQRRLEKLSRLGIGQKLNDGNWRIPPNFLGKIDALPADAPDMSVKSWVPLHQLIRAQGKTILDLHDVHHRDDAKWQRALALREKWLLRQNMLFNQDPTAQPDNERIDTVGRKLAAEANRHYRQLRPGQKFDGIYQGIKDLPDGRFAIVQSNQELTLLRWKPMLEKFRGQHVTASLGKSAVQWQVGRSRTLPKR